MAVKLIVSLILTSALLAGCAPAPPKSLPPYMLGEWQGSDIRFHYHFYENGRYKLMYVPENELDTDGVYRIIGQDDENNIYVAMREKWHRLPKDEPIYYYAKLSWEDTRFKYIEEGASAGFHTLCVYNAHIKNMPDAKTEWDTPSHEQMRRIRAAVKQYTAYRLSKLERYEKPEKNYDPFSSGSCYGRVYY